MVADVEGNIWIASYGNDSLYVFLGGDPNQSVPFPDTPEASRSPSRSPPTERLGSATAVELAANTKAVLQNSPLLTGC